jgi:prepilin-type N-terminal cleavage/methylation domain-containing protein
MSRTPAPASRGTRACAMTRDSMRGFTLTELLVSLVLAGIVLASITSLMMNQSRGFAKQRQIMDAWETDRGTTAILAWEIRHAATGGSGLSVITPDSVTMRAMTGLGVVCGKHPTLPRFALWRTAGVIRATPDDSALVFMLGRDKWRTLKITQVGTPTALGPTTCAWPGSRPPDLVVEVAVTTRWDTASVFVGAPFRSFHKVTYAEVQIANRWWLGRRVGAAASWDQLTGPLLAPSAGGLQFTFYDTLSAVTAVPANVATVGFSVRAQSLKQVVAHGTLDYRVDSIVTKVSLRR